MKRDTKGRPSQHGSTGLRYLADGKPYRALPLLASKLRRNRGYDNLVNYASALRNCGNIDAAIATLEECLTIDSKRPEAWNNLGQCYTDAGKFEQCLYYFQTSLQCLDRMGRVPSAAPGALLSFAHAMMRLGQFEYIWPIWEAARLGQSWHPFPNLEPWRGEPDVKLLVLPEGGFGDGFNFLRWIPAAKQRVKSVAVLVWDQMLDYTKRQFPDLDILPMSHQFQYGDLQRFSHCTPMLSLPGLCGMKEWTDIPAPLDWTPPPTPHGLCSNVAGFCWAAEENGVTRKVRSLDKRAASAVSRHLESKGFKACSLTPTGKQLYRQKPAWKPRRIIHDESWFESWQSSAARVLALSLVVTVDTAVAHLAGSLGVKTLILLPMRSDWKWGSEGVKTPWYGEHVTLFRNPHHAEWDGEAIAQAIDSIL